MGKLRNWKHERFCRAIVFDETPPRDAYTLAGFEPNWATTIGCWYPRYQSKD